MPNLCFARRSLLQSTNATISIPLVSTAPTPDVAPNPTYYTSFPWCKCISNDPFNPVALDYGGIGTYGNIKFMMVYITLLSTPKPANPTTCSGSNVGKVEWNVGESKPGLACKV
jgi:hypothetical protein